MSFHAKYEREDSTGWPIRSWNDANKLLSYFGSDNHSSATFTLESGSYVQCAGAKTRLTVEARIVKPNGNFVHYVFGLGDRSGKIEEIECSVGPISVDATQVLTLRDGRKIIRHFVESGGELPEGYDVQDVSERFRAV
jgi:hypothetical protein